LSVAVIVPVLNRPHRVTPLLASLAGTKGCDALFVASPRDDDEIRAIKAAGVADEFLTVATWEPGPGDYARKINGGAQAAMKRGYDWLFTGADDLTFHPGWLDAAIRAHEEHGGRFVGTNDMWNPSVRNGRHSTHSLIRMDYIAELGCSFDGPGIVYHDGYDHQCVDNEAVFVAKQRGEFVHAADSFVEHLHPFAKKGKMDATYEKALARGRDDIRLFRDRQRAHTPRRSTQR
jgi:GT2 family glycosyltransferase